MPYKDPERQKAAQRAWYLRNHDRLLVEHRNYRAGHREERREYNRLHPSPRDTEQRQRYAKQNVASIREARAKTAKREREMNEFSLVQASRRGLPWTAEEDAMVLAHDAPDLAIALQIGRTRDAVSVRRWRLTA